MGLSAGTERIEMRINYLSALILALSSEKCEKNGAKF